MRSIARAFSFLLPLIPAAAGFCLESKLITLAELRKRVPMTQLISFSKSPVFVRTPDFLLTESDEEPLFSLRGKDKQGNPWRVILLDAARGAWRSNVRGSRTYYFAAYTGGAGFAPGTSI